MERQKSTASRIRSTCSPPETRTLNYGFETAVSILPFPPQFIQRIIFPDAGFFTLPVPSHFLQVREGVIGGCLRTGANIKRKNVVRIVVSKPL